LLILSSVLGLIAAALVFFRVSGADNEKTIVVATASIAAGNAIRADQIKVIPWGTSVIPQGSFRDVKQVVGRVARNSLTDGEPIFDFSLAKPDAKSGLASVIREGSRAISVEADEVSGVAGFVLPGSFVDVLISGKDGEGSSFSKIVLQYVRVLAVEQNTQADPEQPRVVRAVTLELSPEQAERLGLARTIGKLSLVLRNEFDKRPSQSRGARMDDLMEGSPVTAQNPPPTSAAPTPSAARAAAARPSTRGEFRQQSSVEIVRGTRNMMQPD
jgi:pilus assembly protein CpaB